MRQSIYRTLELIEAAKKKAAESCMEKEMSFEEWKVINNHLENAHIRIVDAINKDSMLNEREVL
ncbi:gp198 [Bacillus phage W.Ph.]|uniref:Gp198 n=1 Tax=Bacillus phage W.Ph. TaxID=764595 RepID=G9B1U9_9CAUD|nr:gp198 [Bacillus phage W.Ph.]ADH03344.1 gp198 [Bacillus phage W.Ph.]